ncbi:MAG: hypothetical protein Q8L14_38805 [Myxococcales bacterium]|nr:hypothetical protein [Myxococcales bacterium]
MTRHSKTTGACSPRRDLKAPWLAVAALALLGQGCVEALVLGGGLGMEHIKNTERQPTITFHNGLSEPVCAINLWRASQPAAEADANWLELTDLTRLDPGQQVSVGIRPRDSAYQLRALGCGGRASSLYSVSLSELIPGSRVTLGAPPPTPTPTPTSPPTLPAAVGL